jgi:hypothetical protein
LYLTELALGDYYKCQLLCDEGMKRDEQPSDITLAVVSHQLEPDQDPRDPKYWYDVSGPLESLKTDATYAIIKSLNDVRCFRDAIQVAEDAFGETHDTHDREMLMYAAEDATWYQEDWLEELRENDIRGIDFEVASRVGTVSRNQYPWATPQFLMSAKTPLRDGRC